MPIKRKALLDTVLPAKDPKCCFVFVLVFVLVLVLVFVLVFVFNLNFTNFRS